jgi:hypothetical protein
VKTWQLFGPRRDLSQFFVEINSVLNVVYFADKIFFDFVADMQLLKNLASNHLKVIVSPLNLANVHLVKLK